MEAWAIVVAAGSGSRFGGPKQYIELAGRPLIDWACQAARAACRGVVLVVPAVDVAAGRRWGVDAVVAGGATRSMSVRAGLAAVADDADVVVVHDAARPLAPPGLWAAVITAVERGADAAVPAVAVTDTVKLVEPGGTLSTLDRSRLVAVQTPQAFAAAALRRAHAAGDDATDDAALVERLGGRVVAVDGSPTNIKVTTSLDLTLAAAILTARLAEDAAADDSGRR